VKLRQSFIPIIYIEPNQDTSSEAYWYAGVEIAT